MNPELRYYYVDAQNQAAGPLAMAGLLALKASGTVTDASLVVVEGGTEWVALSTLQPTTALATAHASASTPSPSTGPAPTAQAASASAHSPSSSSSPTTEPPWASQLAQKIDQLTAVMDRLTEVLEKNRPMTNPAPVMAPATAALHAEKINLNPAPKTGFASQNTAAAPPVARPTPLPAGVAVATPRTPVARSGTILSPLAVPANAQKSALPLPALGKTPGPAPAPTTPAKGNIFSKFLKK